MDVLVCFISWIKGIWLCAKSTKAFFVDENFERIDRCDKHIDSHVELVTIEQEWSLEIALHHHWLSICHRGDIVDYLDSSTS